jgi:hypothetical protein
VNINDGNKKKLPDKKIIENLEKEIKRLNNELNEIRDIEKMKEFIWNDWLENNKK